MNSSKMLVIISDIQSKIRYTHRSAASCMVKVTHSQETYSEVYQSLDNICETLKEMNGGMLMIKGMVLTQEEEPEMLTTMEEVLDKVIHGLDRADNYLHCMKKALTGGD